MNDLKTFILFANLLCLPTLGCAKDVALTCPSSGEGSPPIELTLTAAGGFKLQQNQTMFLPLQFHEAKMESEGPGKKITLNCIYISSTDNKTEQKTVTLFAYAPSGSAKCTLVSSDKKEAKLNRLVCKYP